MKSFGTGAILMLILCAGWLFTAGESVALQQITILDCNGKEESINMPVRRAVLLDGHSMLSAIKAIGAEDRVVGVVDSIKEQTTRFPVLSKVRSVGSSSVAIDFETILALQPDIVIANYWYPEELEEKLEPAIQVLRINVGPPLIYTAEVEKIGKIFNREKQAGEFIRWYREKTDTILKRIETLRPEDRPSVFDFFGGAEGMIQGPPYGTVGKNNFWAAPLIDMAGGVNISGKLPGDWIVVDPEWVITENPDIIIREVGAHGIDGDVIGYDTGSSSGLAVIRDRVMKNAGFDTTHAVRNDNVFLMYGRFIHAEWFIGLAYYAKWFHPDLFADIDPAALHQEYLNRFQHLDYDVSKQGIFVYPE